MTQNARITISSTQTADGQEEHMELSVAGSCYEKNGNYYILYEEAAETDRETVRNMIKLTPDSVEIIKRGAVSASMVFQKGKQSRTAYQTSAGRLMMEFQTSRLNWRETGEGLEAEIGYGLSINGIRVSDCSVRIRVAFAS